MGGANGEDRDAERVLAEFVVAERGGARRPAASTLTAVASREAFYEDVLAHVPAVVTRYDRDFRMTYVSAAYTRLTGRPAAELVGKRVDEVGYPADMTALLLELLGRVFAEGLPLSRELTIALPGRRNHYLVDLAPERDAAGAVVAVVAVSTDLTSTRGSEAVLDGVLDALLEGVSVYKAVRGPDGRIVDLVRVRVNPAGERILGAPAAALVGESLLTRYASDEARRHVARFFAVVETGEPYEDELWFTDTDEPRCFRISAVKADDGLALTYQEVTAQKRADEALREREREFRALAEHSPDVIARFDRQLRRLYVNPAITRMTGRPMADFLGKTLDETGVFAPDVLAALQAALREAFDTGRPTSCPLAFTSPDGPRHLQARIEPEPDADGRVATVIVVASDVTALVRAQAEVAEKVAALERANAALAHANAQLREADRYKDEFFSVVSHELRTPLNFITGFASLLEDGVYGELAARQQDAVGKILLGSDRMLRLVNDMLDFSRVSAGVLSLAVRPTPLGPLVEEVAQAMAALAQAKGVDLEAAAPADVVGRVDAGRFVQALTNLVDNAIKFTPAGGRVAIALVPAPGAIALEVRDTGCGIAAADLPRIFQRFHQLDMSATRVAGGTGLGLAITKALVEAHGGRIEVESEPGAGSLFRVVLPTG